MVAGWKHGGLPRGHPERLESFRKASDGPGTREGDIRDPNDDDGRRYPQFLDFRRPADSVHAHDVVRQPSGITTGCRRTAHSFFDEQRQRDEWTDFARWKMGGLCV